MKRFVPGLVFALAASSSAGGGDSVAAAFELRLTRDPCFGFCPAYTVAVDAAGRVRWRGERFVERVGPASGAVDAAAVNRLRRAVRDAGFFALKNEYLDMPVTDLPYATVEVRDGARTKTVRYYAGDPNLPAALVNLAKRVDAELGTSVWIGRKTF